MNPSTIGSNYDTIAHLWQKDTPVSYGIAALERALRFCGQSGVALDVGCGSHGRFLDLLRKRGFTIEGLDISLRMIALAKERSPETTFHTADVCESLGSVPTNKHCFETPLSIGSVPTNKH